MLHTFYKIGEMHFRLLGTNGFHVKAEKDRDLLLRVRVVARTWSMKLSLCRLTDYVRRMHQKACCTCSTIIFPHSTNHIIDLRRCRCRSRVVVSYTPNRPRSIYQYSNMAPRLSGQTSKFGVVFFVSKSLLGIERQKKLKKIAVLTRKLRGHFSILIYRTWPIIAII